MNKYYIEYPISAMTKHYGEKKLTAIAEGNGKTVTIVDVLDCEYYKQREKGKRKRLSACTNYSHFDNGKPTWLKPYLC